MKLFAKQWQITTNYYTFRHSTTNSSRNRSDFLIFINCPAQREEISWNSEFLNASERPLPFLGKSHCVMCGQGVTINFISKHWQLKEEKSKERNWKQFMELSKQSTMDSSTTKRRFHVSNFCLHCLPAATIATWNNWKDETTGCLLSQRRVFAKPMQVICGKCFCCHIYIYVSMW